MVTLCFLHAEVVRKYNVTDFLVVILSEAKDLPCNSREILRCAQNDGGKARVSAVNFMPTRVSTANFMLARIAERYKPDGAHLVLRRQAGRRWPRKIFRGNPTCLT